MFTVRQIQRLWQAGDYRRIAQICLEGRPHAVEQIVQDLSRPLPAAALALIRLEELNQTQTDLFAQLLRFVLASQQPDGSFGPPLTTAVCLRALMCCQGPGLSIDRGIGYLARVQRRDGLWPRVALRRMPGDRFVSALILLYLAHDTRFAEAVRLEAALEWFTRHRPPDEESRTIWRYIRPPVSGIVN